MRTRTLPFAVVGVATAEPSVQLRVDEGPTRPRVDMPMDVLLGKPPKMHRDVKRVAQRKRAGPF